MMCPRVFFFTSFGSPSPFLPVTGDTKNIAKTPAHPKLEQWESQRLYSSPYYYGPIDRRSVLWRVRVGEDQRKCARLRGRWNSDGIDWRKDPIWTFTSGLNTLFFGKRIPNETYNRLSSRFEKFKIFPELSCTFSSFATNHDNQDNSRWAWSRHAVRTRAVERVYVQMSMTSKNSGLVGPRNVSVPIYWNGKRLTAKDPRIRGHEGTRGGKEGISEGSSVLDWRD